MTNNQLTGERLTDSDLEDLISELEAAGFYRRQLICLVELQERRKAGSEPVLAVSADLLHIAASAIEDLLEHTDPNTSYYSGVWADVPGKLRATMLVAGP